ncbi:molybdenum cofactor guanylyltransferase [Oceanobacillus sp. FSL W7-1293]|uniref:molybdenum cofactor guanylyltransferase n=1 Tax=Oceanobacillus TaxID=182709 RepID=UPI0030CC3FC3
MGNIAGLLLAGGQSRRFGSPKAFLRMNEKYFYQYSVDSLREITDSIVVITNTELKALFDEEADDLAIITDNKYVKGAGPLAGIYTGMEYLSADWYMTAPIDVPFINTAIFHTLLSYKKENIDAVVPVVSGEIQPLISIYHHSVKEVILDQLQKEILSVHRLLENLNVRYIPMKEEKCFYNINLREDYDKWIAGPKNENN